jgi:hypothetical protein
VTLSQEIESLRSRNTGILNRGRTEITARPAATKGIEPRISRITRIETVAVILAFIRVIRVIRGEKSSRTGAILKDCGTIKENENLCFLCFLLFKKLSLLILNGLQRICGACPAPRLAGRSLP